MKINLPSTAKLQNWWHVQKHFSILFSYLQKFKFFISESKFESSLFLRKIYWRILTACSKILKWLLVSIFENYICITLFPRKMATRHTTLKSLVIYFEKINFFRPFLWMNILKFNLSLQYPPPARPNTLPPQLPPPPRQQHNSRLQLHYNYYLGNITDI